MKNIFSITSLIICLYARAQTPLIDSIITKNSLHYTISALSSDSMKGRFTGTPYAKNAADFIAGRFKEAGLSSLPGNDLYFSYYPLDIEKSDLKAINVIGTLPGNYSSDTMVIFSAHYDHIGTTKSRSDILSDSIFNGANDNASGVALLIELAKYYSRIKNNRYAILFIAFSGEELGLYGSTAFANAIDMSLIKAAINFDMVGRPINNWKTMYGNCKKCQAFH